MVYPWGLGNCVGDDGKYPGQGDHQEGSAAEVAVCVRLTNSTKAPNTNLRRNCFLVSQHVVGVGYHELETSGGEGDG